jgi:sialic acid synthase SpsE
VAFLSTPFDDASAELLNSIDVPAFKVGSGELTNLPFLTKLAGFGKPIILSTGMAWASETAAAVDTISSNGAPPPAILHCVSNYPADPTDVNLQAMDTLKALFGTPIGYSDHTVGDTVSLAAVACGACIIEKHLTLDRTMPGPDHAASEEPEEFARLVSGIRIVEQALGDGRKLPTATEAEMRGVARRSLITTQPVQAGTPFTADLFTALRPGTGISPLLLDRVLGRYARRDLEVGAILSWDDIS